MSPERDEILARVRALAGARYARWVDSKTSRGDFDGRDWTVEIFDVESSDRTALREALWDLFVEVRKKVGKPMSLVTHTPANTSKLYAWVRAEQTASRYSHRVVGQIALRDVAVFNDDAHPPRRLLEAA